MMKVVKYLLIVNAVTLLINGIIVWLTIVRAFPPILGILIFLACMAGAVWLSCYLNGALPYQHRNAFYSIPAEKIEVP
ncbi:MAG TPA: hypothetical protein VFV38_11985 [Ktedonobacteraceae bacterium]|nr:hypothetical protein [Ktedonobacteraceae bacterium]